MTKAQTRIYDALVAWYKKKPYPPSLEELASAAGIKSVSTAHVHVKNLIWQGKIRRSSEHGRGLELVPQKGNLCPTCGQVVR